MCWKLSHQSPLVLGRSRHHSPTLLSLLLAPRRRPAARRPARRCSTLAAAAATRTFCTARCWRAGPPPATSPSSPPSRGSRCGAAAAAAWAVGAAGARASSSCWLRMQRARAAAACAVLTPGCPLAVFFLRKLQAQKVYVQNRLEESGALVWRLLQAGAHFYACGDAGSMAPAVEAALLRVIAAGQAQGPDAAAAYLQQLAESGRYQRDVWLS